MQEPQNEELFSDKQGEDRSRQTVASDKSPYLAYHGVLVGRFPISGGTCGPDSHQPI